MTSYLNIIGGQNALNFSNAYADPAVTTDYTVTLNVLDSGAGSSSGSTVKLYSVIYNTTLTIIYPGKLSTGTVNISFTNVTDIGLPTHFSIKNPGPDSCYISQIDVTKNGGGTVTFNNPYPTSGGKTNGYYDSDNFGGYFGDVNGLIHVDVYPQLVSSTSGGMWGWVPLT